MVSALLSRCLMLILGTLYPAYRSYKAIKNKDVREHVKWMMYWIVFALFTTLETFLDIFFSWFPFYYEIKILFILWVLSPATRGSSLLYKKVVHPMLTSREKEIDELIEKTKHQGYNTFLQLFTSGFQYASNLFVHSAMKGQYLLGNQLKKSLSMNDVYETDGNLNGNGSSVNQNDNDLYRMPDTINEDDEDIDDFDAESERIRRLNNRQVYESSYKPSKKQSITALNGQHSSNRDYEIVDDGILVDDLNQKTRANSRRRASAKQMSTTNYKTNEASHFGTITRGSAASSGVTTTASMLSGRKVKLNSVPTLNAQNMFSNEIDS